MRKKLSVFQISALAVALSSLLLSVMRVIVLKNNIEINETETAGQSVVYYIARNSETVVFLVFTCCFFVAFAALAFVLGKKANSFISFDSSPAVFASSLCGFMFLSTGLYYSYQYVTGNGELSKFVISLAMVASSAMFLNMALQKEGKQRKSVLYLRFVVCGYAILRLILEFIEQNRRPTNSASAFHIISLIAFMLFIVYDSKTEFSQASMRPYLASGYSCILFMLIYAIPNLAITLLYKQIDPYILFSAADISLAFYAFSRVFSVCRVCQKD